LHQKISKTRISPTFPFSSGKIEGKTYPATILEGPPLVAEKPNLSLGATGVNFIIKMIFLSRGNFYQGNSYWLIATKNKGFSLLVFFSFWKSAGWSLAFHLNLTLANKPHQKNKA